MKPILKYIVIFFIFISVYSCQSSLKEEIYSELGDDYINTDNALNSILTSAYGNAQIRQYAYFYTPGMVSGETWGQYGAIESFFTPLVNYTWNSNLAYFGIIWNQLYAVIRDANIVISKAAGNSGKAQLVAEAKFLRGQSYYLLHDWFGPVPLHKTPSDDVYLARATESETINFIEQDLKEAAAVLPEKQAQYGKATKGAALAFLTKLYLNAKQWQKCADAAQQVIDLNTYSLFADYTKLFLIENEANSEMIWVIQGTPKVGTPFIANTYPMDYPHLNNQTLYASEVYLYDDFVNSFEQGDQRKKLIITSYTNTKGVFKQLLGNNRSIPGKYELDKNAIGASYGNDIPVIRYADILLSRAEALNELNGPNSESIVLINKVRSRAGLESLALSGVSKESLRLAIFKEREWEFWFEQQNRTDRIRQGTLITNATDHGRSGAKPYHVLFPIPQTEIDANPKLVQNKGY
ncbi:RagB/SusD family nutrient uptake outer membrane protein [Niabella aquatica]